MKLWKYRGGVGTLILLAIGIVLLNFSPAAAVDTEFSQTISAGTLSVDIKDGSEVSVVSPSVIMSPLNTSPTCQTSTGTLGTNTQRIYVENPDAADSGWVLSIAATGGASTMWTSGSDDYDFNSPSGTGCTDGQMTVDPSVASMSLHGSSALTGVSMGSQAAFHQGTTDSIELVNAGSTSDDVWKGYLTGITISQKVPASIPAGTYTIDLTKTVVSQ